MKFFLLLLLCFIAVFSYSQKTLRIEYKQEIVEEKFTPSLSDIAIPLKNNVNLSQLRMLINDSIVQIHFFSRYYDPIKKKTKKIGEKLINHGNFYDLKYKKYYNQCSLNKTLKYLIPIDTTQYKSWNTLDMQKIILGYTCKAALSINEKNDSTLVWFTNDLSVKNGFLFYYGVPGVVLEAYNQGINATMHYWAIKIEETEIELFRPKEGNIISQKGFSEIMKTRSEKIEGTNFFKVKKTSVY